MEHARSLPPPHAPAPSRWKRWLGRFYISGVFWYRFHHFGVRVLPEWAMGPLLCCFTAFFFLTLRRIRRAIASNLEAVLGPCGRLERERRIFRTLHQFAWCLSERYEQFGTGKRIESALEGVEHWKVLEERGGGFIVVTAHVGPWEAGAAVPGALRGRTVHLVREEEMDPAAQRFIEGLVARGDGPPLRTHFASADPLLGVRLLEALRSGDVVALQGDRPRADGGTVEAPFLGRTLAFPVGPAALARAAGVPLVPVFVFREGRLRSRVELRAPIVVRATGDRDADVTEATRRLAGEVERAVRVAPHQWFCFAPLWAGPGSRA